MPTTHSLPIAFALEPFGSLTPQALNDTVDEVMSAFPDVEYDTVPYDLGALMPGETIVCPTVTADGKLTEASYTLATFDAVSAEDSDSGQASPMEVQAVIDCAPLTAQSHGDTYGVGVLIADALSRGATTIALLTDGVRTTDGGSGILVGLGAQFYTAQGHAVARGRVEDIATMDTAQFNMQALGAHFLVLGGMDSFLPAPESCTQLAELLGVDPTAQGMGAGGGIPLALRWMHPDAEHMVAPQALYVANVAGHLDPDIVAIVLTDEMTADSVQDPGHAVGALMAAQVPMIVVARSVPAAFGRTGIIPNMPVPTIVVDDDSPEAVREGVTRAVEHLMNAQNAADDVMNDVVTDAGLSSEQN